MPAAPAAFVVTVEDAVTKQPLTTGVSVVTDNGRIGHCYNASPVVSDGGAISCTDGWEVDFSGNSNTTTTEAHAITVSAQGYRPATLQVTAAFTCGNGSDKPTNVVAALQPQ